MTSKKVNRFGTFNHVADKVIQEKGLSVADFGLWAYLFRHGNSDGYIVISNKRIMRDLNIKNAGTLRKHIKNLVTAGLIGIDRKGAKDRTPTKYWYKKKSKPSGN